ncbi:MAG: CRISPR/Cas system-associated exonuclease Cas4 (RecB family) [Candidatus Nanohaloarchaea archaeon]|jgi:CRISPR/Cas system-associated exonuclease Cas4 (RecB family)
MNLFFECERCFWLRVNEKVNRPSGPFPSLPSGVDQKVKNHFDRFRQKDESPPELQDLDLKLLEDTEFLENARSWRTEPKWHADEIDAVLRGGVDDLLRDENGDIVVMDYKTRGYPPKQDNGAPDYYRRQVNLYNLILRENGYPTADYGLILYFYPEKFTENGDFVFHTEIREVEVDMEKARGMVEDAVETLEGGKPDHSDECDFCGWSVNDH